MRTCLESSVTYFEDSVVKFYQPAIGIEREKESYKRASYEDFLAERCVTRM